MTKELIIDTLKFYSAWLCLNYLSCVGGKRNYKERNALFFSVSKGFNMPYGDRLLVDIQARINRNLSYFKKSVENSPKKEKIERLRLWLERFAGFMGKVEAILSKTKNQNLDDICLFDPDIDLREVSAFIVDDLNLTKAIKYFYIYTGTLKKVYFDKISDYFLGNRKRPDFDSDKCKVVCAYNIDDQENNRLYQSLKDGSFIEKRFNSSGNKATNKEQMDDMFHFLCTDDIFLAHMPHHEHDMLRSVMYIFLDTLSETQKKDFYTIVYEELN